MICRHLIGSGLVGRRFVPVAVVVAAAALCPVVTVPVVAAAGTDAVGGARAATSEGTWGTAEEVPGTAALNTGATRASPRCRAARPVTAAAAGGTPIASVSNHLCRIERVV